MLGEEETDEEESKLEDFKQTEVEDEETKKSIGQALGRCSLGAPHANLPASCSFKINERYIHQGQKEIFLQQYNIDETQRVKPQSEQKYLNCQNKQEILRNFDELTQGIERVAEVADCAHSEHFGDK